MNTNDNPKISIQGDIVSVGRINGSLGSSSVMGSVSLGREIIPKYADIILRFEHVDDFPFFGDERLIYLDMSSMTMYLWDGSSYLPVSNSENAILMDTTENWNAQRTFRPERKDIVIYTDHGQVDDGQGNLIDVPGIKIGDGDAYLIDLPFVGADVMHRFLGELLRHTENTAIHVSLDDRLFWNNKLNCIVDDGNLVFNRM